MANNAPASISASPVKSSIPTTYVWILALLPLLVFGLLSIPAGMVPEDAPDEVFGAIGLIALLLTLTGNFFFLQKEGKILAGIQRREEMLVFMRVGIFSPPCIFAHERRSWTGTGPMPSWGWLSVSGGCGSSCPSSDLPPSRHDSRHKQEP